MAVTPGLQVEMEEDSSDERANGRLRLLYVEDHDAFAEVVMEHLAESPRLHVSTHRVRTRRQAIDAVRTDGPFDAALVDLGLPDSHGSGLVADLLIHAPRTAVIVLTGRSGMAIATGVLRQGATDFINKNDLDADHLHRTLQFALARKAFESTLRDQADTDPLTGVANRRGLQAHFRSVAGACRRSQTPLTVAMIDLNRFKQLNDTQGHAAGDMVLREIAARLEHTVRESDLVGRIGGDEFAVVAQADEIATDQLQQRLEDAVHNPPIVIGDQQITISVGVAIGSGHDALDSLLRKADRDMYRGKHAGLGARTR